MDRVSSNFPSKLAAGCAARPPTPLQNWRSRLLLPSNFPSKLALDMRAFLQLPFKTGSPMVWVPPTSLQNWLRSGGGSSNFPSKLADLGQVPEKTIISLRIHT